MAGYNAGAERTDFIKNSGAVTTFTLMPALPVARRQMPLTYYILIATQDGDNKLGVISKKKHPGDVNPLVQIEELDTPPETEAKWTFKPVQE
ncbi:hypothetical protein FRC07_010601 [Ceratobasidium sp. 392]|nr:hypothetical protein FRC07_010601 [Ceratobasidium sp. 392]